MGSFGIIFNELFMQLQMGSTSITLFNGVNAMCVALSGKKKKPFKKSKSKGASASVLRECYLLHRYIHRLLHM